MTVDPMRSTSPTMKEDHLKSSLSGKTNYSRPYTANASEGDFKGTSLLKGYKQVTQKHPLPDFYGFCYTYG